MINMGGGRGYALGRYSSTTEKLLISRNLPGSRLHGWHAAVSDTFPIYSCI
jgi:hypothetical protein